MIKKELPPINQRVRQLIEKLSNGNVTAFSRKLGYNSAQKLNRLFMIDNRTGKHPVPSSTIISDISNAFDVNTNWIITGDGNMFNENGAKTNEAVPLALNNIVYVPFVNQYAYAGYEMGYENETYLETLPKIPFIVDHQARGNYVAFEVKGDSMDDGSGNSYIEGDIVLCREVQPTFWAQGKLHINKWDFVIVSDEGIVVKQIIKHDVENHTVTIHSLNDYYQDRDIDLINVKQIFNVVQSIRPRRR